MAEDKKCSWHFRDFRPEEDKLQGANDPIIQKFKENFYNSLVRESIQNSMDAKTETATLIEVKYELNSIHESQFPGLFGLKEHIFACKETHIENNRAQELYGPMSEFMDAEEIDILTISDYGTEGMPYTPDNIYKNPFQAFVNSDGQSVKNMTNKDGSTASNGGSFGIGKGAYFLMSPVRSVLVSTMVNDSEQHTYFEGVSRLCTHDIAGKHYYHMGFYSNDGKTPVEGDDIPELFKRHKPGTSISLIGKYADLGSNSNVEDEIEKAVISNFWLAIYNEKLMVTVGQRQSITKETLEQKMLNMFPNEYAKDNPFLFYKAYTTTPDNHKYFKFEINDNEYLGHCELYIQIGEPGKKDKITCMRDMMMLIQTIPSPHQHHAGISGTFICLGQPGNGNFELTEDESHTSWSAKGKQGEAKKRANRLIEKMNTFIGEKIDSIIGIDDDRIDVPIDSINSMEIHGSVAEEGTGGNPFGTIVDPEHPIKDGFDRFSIPVDVSKKLVNEFYNSGEIVSGPTDGSRRGEAHLATGPTAHKKTAKHLKHPKPGKKREEGDIEPDSEERVYKIIPTYFDVAAHLENGEWVHSIYMELDDDAKLHKKVYVDVTVGSDNSPEALKVDIKSAKTKEHLADIYHSRVYFESTVEDNITLDIVFIDNMRHTINLG